MEIFLDTADMKEIKKWLDLGLLDGVTTNPSIMVRDGIYDFEKGAKEIAALIYPRPLSVEVTTSDLDEMVEQAKYLSSLAPNIVVKIPQTTEEGVPCYGVMRKIEGEGVQVNATVAMSLGHVICSAKAGATYVSIFVGRVGDEGGDPYGIVEAAVNWLERWEYRTKVIAASIRSVVDVVQCAIAGAHIITVPPGIMRRLVEHKNTRASVEQFLKDARKAMEMAEKMRR